MEILGFFAMVLGTLADPIRTPGYIISGWVIKNFAGAVTVSILWNLLAYAVLIAPQAARDQRQLSAEVFYASCAGAVLATGIVYWFASRRRRRRHGSIAAGGEKNERKLKELPAEEAGVVLADFVRRRMHDTSPPPAVVSEFLSAGGVDRAVYDREEVLLSLFCGEVVVRTTLPENAQRPVLDSYFSAVDLLFQSDSQYQTLRPQVQSRLQAYRQALSTTDTSPDTMMAVGRTFAKFCTGEDRFNLAMIADLSFKAQLEARAEFFRSVRIDISKTNDNRRLMLDLIRQNADRIQQTEGRTRKDAEYLAICVLIDDLAVRPHGAEGHRLVMDILAREYQEHQNDVLTYVAVKSGTIKLKPDAEQKWTERHRVKRK